jgi:hypothetical protein
MMPFAGLCAILGMIFIAWRLHEWHALQKAKARYEYLSGQWIEHEWAASELHREYYSWASVQSRGVLLDWQARELNIHYSEMHRLSAEMNACAREF